MPITNDDVEALYKLDQQIKAFTREADALKARIREGLEPNTYKAGRFELTVRPPTATIPTDNHAAFVHAFPVEDNEDLYETRPKSMTVLRKLMEFDEIEPFVRYSQPAVIIKTTKSH